MGRRKKGRAVDGWLILDKPYDMGSTEAVSKIRWLFDAQKAGHAGTLDPLATGLLPIALGEATKTVPYVQDGLKTYQFTARWGEARSTDDLEGDVTRTSDVRPTRAAIDAILPSFTGTIMQRPPAFSAIKIDGQRAYDLAREGAVVVPDARPITIEQLRVVEELSADETVFEAVTGKGTYVRAMVRDMADALGTVGYVSQLRRTAVGPFDVAQSVRFEDLTGQPDNARLGPEDRDPPRYDPFLAGLDGAFADQVQVSIDRAMAARLSVGGDAVLPPMQVTPIRQGSPDDIEPILALEGDRPIAICRLEGLKLRPIKVFNVA